MRIIDYRSDTVTKPTKEMKQFMFDAPVGDDVFVEDPTINELEEYAADLFGMEKAIYCPSGTMTNQIAIKVHTTPGDELICSYESHIYRYEGGGIAGNSLVSTRLIPGITGLITADQVEENINADDIHLPKTSLVSLENTSNRGGGLCYDFSEIEKIKAVCDKHGLKLHLDGARLFNALIAKNETPKQYGSVFDSISICLSKGLGAPVGSLLLGNIDFIKDARRKRKLFGGGMRQAGIIAAGGLYALKNHVGRLDIDHKHAQRIGNAFQSHEQVESIEPVETNIVMVNTKNSAKDWLEELEKHNVLAYAMTPTRLRLVTHLDLTDQDIDDTIKIISSIH